MNKDLEIQANFAIEKGKRETDRLISDCLKEIRCALEGKEISLRGRLCKLKALSKDDNFEKLVFDVLNPSDTYDHIEFTIKKTGWGRMMLTTELN